MLSQKHMHYNLGGSTMKVNVKSFSQPHGM